MERYTIFTDWRTEYCQNDHIIQGNWIIQINAILIKTLIAFVETPKILNSQNYCIV